jgi:hypothetical protein
MRQAPFPPWPAHALRAEAPLLSHDGRRAGCRGLRPGDPAARLARIRQLARRSGGAAVALQHRHRVCLDALRTRRRRQTLFGPSLDEVEPRTGPWVEPWPGGVPPSGPERGQDIRLAFVSLLHGLLQRDIVLTMPPWRRTFTGRDEVARFMTGVWPRYHGFRAVAVVANGQPAAAVYARRDDAPYLPHSLHVLAGSGQVGEVVLYTPPLGASLFAAFGLAPTGLMH